MHDQSCKSFAALHESGSGARVGRAGTARSCRLSEDNRTTYAKRRETGRE